MIKTSEERYDGVVVFDDETGEVFYHSPAKTKKVSSFDKYVGVDTKYPEECITRESLIESLSVLDAYVQDDKIWMASDMLVEAVAQGLVTPQQLKLIRHIIKNLTGWNTYIGSIRDLCSCGIDSRNMTRLLTELSPQMVRIVQRNKPLKGDIVLQVNPFYGWKGDNEYRTMKLNKWYKIGTDID